MADGADESGSTAKTGVQILGEIMKAAGDDPKVKEAAHNLGETAVTVTKLVNNALLPLAAINFAFQKAKDYFAKHFERDLSDKTKLIPPADVQEPKASLAGPALQGLAFAHEEPNLKDMYLTLLSNAMDRRVAAGAHPAFVEIIKQLTSEEARLLQTILSWSSAQPIAEIRINVANVGSGGYVTLRRHVMAYADLGTGTPLVNERLPAMVDNWVRLGLVEVSYLAHVSDPKSYEWVETRPELIEAREKPGQNGAYYHKGLILRTALGLQFAMTVGLVPGATSEAAAPKA